MISFKKWLEFSDQGGEVSYNHMNNVAADDGFGQLRSKWMAPQQKKEKIRKYSKYKQ
jgi:hypothetical protein